MCRNTNPGTVRLAVDIQSGFDHLVFIRSKCVCQRIERAVFSRIVRELADLDITHVRRTLTCLKGHHQLVVHIGVWIGCEGDGNRLVRILFVPEINHLSVKFVVDIHEGPHLELGAVFRTDSRDGCCLAFSACLCAGFSTFSHD